MKFLLVYKGHYGENLTGPELRNIGITQALLTSGHGVCLAGREKKRPQALPDKGQYVCLRERLALARSFFSAEVIVLHGGGPLLLTLTFLAGLLGKRIVLDCYAPRWIELDSDGKAQEGVLPVIKRYAMASFNVWRNLAGVLLFDAVICANRRQQDLLRGMLAPFFLSGEFERINIIPFGCDVVSTPDKPNGRQLLSELSGGSLTAEDFAIGWLGGVYDWFDLDSLLTALVPAIRKDKSIKMVFFGVCETRQRSLLAGLPDDVNANIVFLPWVEFKRRFDYWAGLDLALVWGGEGPENDYASRTRNFDCLSLGLPVLQNWDDEWGDRIERYRLGDVAEIPSLSADVLELKNSPEKLATMAGNMTSLAPRFHWTMFANTLVEHLQRAPMFLLRRLWGGIVVACLSPALFLSALAYGIKKIWRKR